MNLTDLVVGELSITQCKVEMTSRPDPDLPFGIGFAVAPLCEVLLTQSLTSLRICHCGTEEIFEAASRALGHLEALETLMIDEKSFSRLIPYPDLFSNIRRLFVEPVSNLELPTLAVPDITKLIKLQVLACPLDVLPEFVGCPIQELKVYWSHRQPVDLPMNQLRGIQDACRDLLSHLSALTLVDIPDIPFSYLMEATVAHCDRLKSLQVEFHPANGEESQALGWKEGFKTFMVCLSHFGI
jgi:hypothetical protein